MAASAAPSSSAPLELPINEARARFVQLARLARLARQVSVVCERGEPVAAIVPVDLVDERREAPGAAAGWLQRIDRIREHLRRQHAVEVGELRQALEEAWTVVDRLSPPGADRRVDAQRVAHAHLRRLTGG